jgi:hypothetical protein
MIKEFPYYDRCKGVFDINAVTSPAAIDESDSSRKTLHLMDSSMEGLHMTHEPNSPTLNTPKPETMASPEKRVPIRSHSSAAGSTATNTNSDIRALKKHKIQPYTSRYLNEKKKGGEFYIHSNIN